MENEITFFQIELSPENNEFYTLCQKYRKQIERLQAEGFFNVNGGRAIVDFKDGGHIDNVILVLSSASRGIKSLGLPNV